MAIPFTVAAILGKVCSIVASLVVPFVVGGGRCREMGVLGIQPPKSNCNEQIMDMDHLQCITTIFSFIEAL